MIAEVTNETAMLKPLKLRRLLGSKDNLPVATFLQSISGTFKVHFL